MPFDRLLRPSEASGADISHGGDVPVLLSVDSGQYAKLRSCGNPLLAPEKFLRVDSRAGYCLVYCPFWPPNRGYFIDSMD
jgi:hypothetical protein